MKPYTLKPQRLEAIIWSIQQRLQEGAPPRIHLESEDEYAQRCSIWKRDLEVFLAYTSAVLKEWWER